MKRRFFMITRLSKNVVCIKDIPSNLIEEAFFILKTNGKVESKEPKRKEIIMNEIDELIQEYSVKFQAEKEQKRKDDIAQKNKLRKIKTRTFWLAIAFVAICITLATIF